MRLTQGVDKLFTQCRQARGWPLKGRTHCGACSGVSRAGLFQAVGELAQGEPQALRGPGLVALVLRQGGVLMAVGNTLVVGLSGRLVGMNPSTGAVLWEAPVATPRGTNDIERLVDLVAGVGRQGDVICTRAFQAAVGCVDAQKGRLNWKQVAQGSVGLAGDTQQVYGVEEDGRVVAWRLGGGELVWHADGLRYRQLTAPLVIGRSVAVGDANGWIHLLSHANGSVLTRLGTDGSGIAATPVEVAGTLVAVTRRGGVYGYRPD